MIPDRASEAGDARERFSLGPVRPAGDKAGLWLNVQFVSSLNRPGHWYTGKCPYVLL